MSTPPPLPNTPPPVRPKGQSAGATVALVIGIIFAVIFVIGILAGIATPAYNGIRESGMRTKSVSNVRQINLGLRVYATDHDGAYPEKNRDGQPYMSSQNAFNSLIPDYVDSESVFWISTRDPNSRVPEENGVLQKGECVYGYAAGHTMKSKSDSPVVFEGFLQGPNAECTEYVPFIKKKKAITGFLDGSVSQLPLSSNRAGATIMSRDGAIPNIMLPRDKGGLLDTTMDNIQLPIGYSLD